MSTKREETREKALEVLLPASDISVYGKDAYKWLFRLCSVTNQGYDHKRLY